MVEPKRQLSSFRPVEERYCPTKWSAAESSAKTFASATMPEQMVRSDKNVGGVLAPGCNSYSTNTSPLFIVRGYASKELTEEKESGE